MAYQRDYMTGATIGTGTANLSGAHEFTPTFSEYLLLNFQFYVYVLFVPFALFHLTIVLAVLLRFTDYDYPFGIYKLFSINREQTQ